MSATLFKHIGCALLGVGVGRWSCRKFPAEPPQIKSIPPKPLRYNAVLDRFDDDYSWSYNDTDYVVNDCTKHKVYTMWASGGAADYVLFLPSQAALSAMQQKASERK